MLFAQSVLEYGALASIAAAAQRALYSAQDWVLSQGTSTWMVVGGVVLLWLIVSRFRSSRL
jgi:type VI protein secretion system component VasK